MKFELDNGAPYVEYVYYLKRSNWNNYGYNTTYEVFIIDREENKNSIGYTNIGELGLEKGSPSLPNEFSKLPENFFSFGNEDYYNFLLKLPNKKGYDILIALNDLTIYPDIFDRVKNENVLKWSLFRDKDINITYKYWLKKILPPLNFNTMLRVYGSTGWNDIDIALIEIQRLLRNPPIDLYYNAIACIGREIIIKLANLIYKDDIMRDVSKYPKQPTKNQCINMLHGYIDYCYAKKEFNCETKQQIKSTIDMVNNFVHKDDGSELDGNICVQSVINLVYLISIVDKYTNPLEVEYET